MSFESRSRTLKIPNDSHMFLSTAVCKFRLPSCCNGCKSLSPELEGVSSACDSAVAMIPRQLYETATWRSALSTHECLMLVHSISSRNREQPPSERFITLPLVSYRRKRRRKKQNQGKINSKASRSPKLRFTRIKNNRFGCETSTFHTRSICVRDGNSKRPISKGKLVARKHRAKKNPRRNQMRFCSS